MKGWKLIALATALGVVLMFAVVSIARGANGDRGIWRGLGMMSDGSGMMRGGEGGQGGPCGGAGAELMGSADFRADMRKLRDEHRRDTRAWRDTYGSDASSTAAQNALRALRTGHWSEVRDLFSKYGVELPEAPPTGRGSLADGGGGCGGGCGQSRAWGGGSQNSGIGIVGGGMMGADAI